MQDAKSFKYRRSLSDREILAARKAYWAAKAHQERETFERTGIPPGLQ